LALIVQKYGGSSVASLDKIKAVAKRVMEARASGNRVVVVLSAMAGETDQLIKQALELTELPDLREYDSLICIGEQKSTALLAMAINAMGGKAISLLAYQVPIRSDGAFKDARITRVETERIRELLNKGYIVVIAGFQGIDPEGNINTLGRGGSDTTAVAVAAALKADECEVYSDVDGIYSADPNVCMDARKMERIAHEEMLELASLGARVLQIRSVKMAMMHDVPLHVRSSFSRQEGTRVVKGDRNMERIAVTGVAYDKNQAKVTLTHVPDRPGIAAALFKPISNANIVVDMIIQNVSEKGYTDLTFTVKREDLARTRRLAEAAARKLRAGQVITDDNIAKVSIVGMGMKEHAGIASKMFETLAKAGINIQMISTSEIKVSCVIDEKYTELAARELHNSFKLGKKPSAKKKAVPLKARKGGVKKAALKKRAAKKRK
jgi:aspartate kinase